MPPPVSIGKRASTEQASLSECLLYGEPKPNQWKHIRSETCNSSDSLWSEAKLRDEMRAMARYMQYAVDHMLYICTGE